MKNKSATELFLLLVILALNHPVFADCDAVERAISAASHQFASSRGIRARESDDESYLSDYKYDDMKCLVGATDDQGMILHCMEYASSFVDAKNQAADLASGIEDCARARGPVKRSPWKYSSTDRGSMSFELSSTDLRVSASEQDVIFIVYASCTIFTRTTRVIYA